MDLLLHKTCTTIAYEPSPLNRPIKIYGPGLDWNNNGKAQNRVYTSNTVDVAELRCLKFTVGAKAGDDMTVTADGYYPAGSLQVIKVSDEDGKTQLVFSDPNGNTVLTRQTEGSSSSPVTYGTYQVPCL